MFVMPNLVLYVVNFWMQLLGGKKPEAHCVLLQRTMGFSQLNVGPLTKQFHIANTSLTWTRRRGAGFRAVLHWKLRRPFLGCTGAIDVELCTFVNLFLRCYPAGFAQRLLTIYEGAGHFRNIWDPRLMLIGYSVIEPSLNKCRLGMCG